MLILGIVYNTITLIIYGLVIILGMGLLYKNYLRKKDEKNDKSTTK